MLRKNKTQYIKKKTHTLSLSYVTVELNEEFLEREKNKRGAYGCAWLLADSHSWSTRFKAFQF
jgi:hypothetical protein